MTHLPVRKDGALVSVEDIPNDRLEGRFEDIFLRRKAGEDVVEPEAGLDLPRSASFDNRDGLVGSAGADDGESSMFLFAFVQWTDSYHHLDRRRRCGRKRGSGTSSRG